MNIATALRSFRLASVLAGTLVSAAGQAGVVSIDKFAVQENGAAVFTDTFSNNLTPSQEAGTYNVSGAFLNGAESAGRLTLDSNWGVVSQNALGQSRQVLAAQWASNVNPALPGAGLDKGSTITVSATFDLVAPAGPLIDAYGIQVQDIIFSQGQDRVLELVVQYNAAFGGDVIRLIEQDFSDKSLTTLGFVPLAPPAGADQIELTLSRPDATGGSFFGAFAFGSGGNFAPASMFATPGHLFDNTDYVRARFVSYAQIPEPGTLVLVALAFTGIAISRRRVREHRQVTCL